MSDNPYSPPNSELEVKEILPPRPVFGITMGILIDLGGTMLLGVASGFIYAAFLASEGMPLEEIEALLGSYDPMSLYGIVNVFLGLFMSYVGGLYCAKISRATSYLYPGIMAAILTALMSAVAWGSMDDLLFVILSAMSVLAIFCGARSHLKRRAE